MEKWLRRWDATHLFNDASIVVNGVFCDANCIMTWDKIWRLALHALYYIFLYLIAKPYFASNRENNTPQYMLESTLLFAILTMM
mgnify:CR=1 FL=1